MSDEFDEETLRIARGYYGSDPREARTKTIEVFAEWGEAAWSPDEFLKLIGAAVESIPAEHRKSAVVEIAGDYDEASRLIIRYSRPETPDEVAARVKEALAYARGQQASERATYEALKRKFE